MPKGTRVHRCVTELKETNGRVNPYGICQASTGQSYKTGRKIRKQARRGRRSSR
jgi:hypothetical protein